MNSSGEKHLEWQPGAFFYAKRSVALCKVAANSGGDIAP